MVQGNNSNQEAQSARESGTLPVNRLFDLTGKVALVTGAGRGIGRAFAEGLAEAGADVVCTGRNIDHLQDIAKTVESLGRKSLAVPADIGSEADVRQLFSEIEAVFGRLDILVNNAAAPPEPALAHELSLEAWQKVIDIDLTGTFLCAREALKIMVGQKSGKIINVSSTQGLVATSYPLPPAPDYCAAKGAVIQLTRELAIEYAPYGINVNCIAPGLYLTDMAEEVFTQTPEFQDWKNSQYFRYKLRGPGKPEDLKGTVVYLASRASDFVSGHTLVADQGYIAW